MARLAMHVKHSPNYNRFQSAYRRGHNTETAVLRMLNVVYHTADSGTRTMLLQLNLSSAFDTLDTITLLRRLRFTFGISGPALNWVSSYSVRRCQICSFRREAFVDHQLRVWSPTRLCARTVVVHTVRLSSRNGHQFIRGQPDAVSQRHAALRRA